MDDRGYADNVDRAGTGAFILRLTGEAKGILYGIEEDDRDRWKRDGDCDRRSAR